MHRRPLLRLFLLSALPLVPCCGEPPLAQGHEHEHPSELEPVGVTRFGARALLFLEHPRLVRGEPARFLAHVTVLATGEPVRSGSATLRIGASTLRAEAPRREGLFVPEGSLPAAGAFSAQLTIESEQVQEAFELGEVVVHEDAHAAAHAAEAEATDEPSDAVPFLLEQQWKVKLLLAEAGPRTLSERHTVPARAAAREGAAATVSAPFGGRLAPPRSGAFPRSGERVEAGQALASVEPPLAAPDLAQLRALDLEFDLKALDVLRAVGEAEARLRFAERELDRLARLRPDGLSTQQQVDLAEQNLAVARNESAAASGMKSTLDALVASRRERSDARPAGAFDLVAPVEGTLVEVRRAPGESVAQDEPVFRILDSSRLWVEGRVLEFDLPRVLAGSGAVATFAAAPGRRFELSGEPPFVGPEIDETSRTALVRYELDNADSAVRVGMMASLEIAARRVDAAVAVPLEAVVDDQGLATAYVMLEGELFQRRALELGVRDGPWVEVRRGIAPGERVANRGAYLVRLAASAPASIGHGHAH